LDLEELTEEDLDHIRESYEHLARQAREGLRAGHKDKGSPEVKLD
jgi:hypothetical protein